MAEITVGSDDTVQDAILDVELEVTSKEPRTGLYPGSKVRAHHSLTGADRALAEANDEEPNACEAADLIARLNEGGALGWSAGQRVRLIAVPVD